MVAGVSVMNGRARQGGEDGRGGYRTLLPGSLGMVWLPLFDGRHIMSSHPDSA